MRISPLLLLSLAGLSFPAAGLAQPFVRTMGGCTFFQESGFSNQSGSGIAAGTALGRGGRHELSIEADWIDWEYRSGASRLDPIAAASLGDARRRMDDDTGDGRLRPLLVGYRYRFGQPEGRMRPYVGASLGITRVEGDWLSYREAGPMLPAFWYEGGHFAEWSAAWGAGAGVEIAVGASFSVDLGYRYLAVRGFRTSLTGSSLLGVNPTGNFRYPELGLSDFSVGLRYRF